jgi:CRISPR-associated protein Csm4
MPSFATYRLSFHAPLHIGERGVGLETTRNHIPADTLFSAICSAWRGLYDVEDLRINLLQRFDKASAKGPFFITSAFPFAGPIRFFPKPALNSQLEIAEGETKAFKRVRFVSEGVFAKVVNAEPLTFNRAECVNDKTVWLTKDEKETLDDFTDDATGDIVLWKSFIVPRVTLDRITSTSEIWHFGRVMFVDRAGLWFSVDFNSDTGEEFRRKFDGALRLLGDEGLGGERGAGHGLFSFDGPREEELPNAGPSDRFITLAPVRPRDATQAEALIAGQAAYELMPRRGWITSLEASNLRRKTVWMFAEGSVLNNLDNERPGSIVNVKPDLESVHDVWRYGYSFPVGVKA